MPVIVFGAGHVLGTKSYMGYTEDTAMLDLAQRKAEYARLYGQETHVMYVTEIASYQGVEDFIRNVNADLSSFEHSNADDSINEEPNEPDRVVVYRTVQNPGDGCCRLIGNACSAVLNVTPVYVEHRTNSTGGDYFGVLKRAMQAGCSDAWLIEHGFHTNDTTRVQLSDPNKRQQLAEKEVDAMAGYYGWEKSGGGGGGSDAMLYKGCPDGEAVKEWQESLIKMDKTALPTYGADGNFGTETEAWTNKFKVAVNLPADGKVDDLTYGRMLNKFQNEFYSEGVVTALRAEVSALKMENAQLKKLYDAEVAKNATLTAEIASLKNQIAIRDAKIASLTKQLSDLNVLYQKEHGYLVELAKCEDTKNNILGLF